MDEGAKGGERNEEARRKSKERRQEEWKINSKRARGRQVGRGRTLRYQQEEGGWLGGRGVRQAFFMRFIGLIKRPVVM